MAENDFLDLVRLTPNQRNALFSRMRAIARADARYNAVRTSTRRDFAGRKIPLVLKSPEGDVVRFLTCSRDLSEGGASLLHGGFVHVGSACVVRLPKLSGGTHDVPGQIVRCTFIEGRIHDVGVQFQAPIDLDEFAPADHNPAETHAPLPTSITARLLVCAPNPQGVETLLERLRQTGADIDLADTFQALLEKLAEKHPAAILLQNPVDTPDARPPLPLIRSAGFEDTVIALLDAPDPALQKRLADDGRAACIWRTSAPDRQFETVAPILAQRPPERPAQEAPREAA